MSVTLLQRLVSFLELGSGDTASAVPYAASSLPGQDEHSDLQAHPDGEKETKLSSSYSDGTKEGSSASEDARRLRLTKAVVSTLEVHTTLVSFCHIFVQVR